jgi:FSR family fosmidomycin resistance protein-like MFS transporter
MAEWSEIAVGARTGSKPMWDSAVLGLVHALVDAGSGYLLFRDLAGESPRAFGALIVVYDSIAFGGQVPAGWILDRFRASRVFAGEGVALVAAALLVANELPVLGVVLVGVGNALFHVGAGAHVLRRSARRAAEGGVFVAPGALGIFAGVWLGSQGVSCRAVLVGLLAAAFAGLLWLLPLERSEERSPPEPVMTHGRQSALAPLLLAAVCLLSSVVVRSVAGGAVNGAWRAIDPGLLVWLAIAAFAGKAAGGFAADRLGWARTSAVALVAAAPLLSVWIGSAGAAVLGMLLLQSTMPVTLKATHLVMPRRPGLAFGLPCLALLLGVLIGLAPLPALSSAPGLFTGLLLSAALVVAGLRLLEPTRAASGELQTEPEG